VVNDRLRKPGTFVAQDIVRLDPALPHRCGRARFDDPSYDHTRQKANEIADYLRAHGPFEPHRLPLEEMEYTTMPSIAKKLADRWQELD
jgi:fructose 1,6-bisphosphatase